MTSEITVPTWITEMLKRVNELNARSESLEFSEEVELENSRCALVDEFTPIVEMLSEAFLLTAHIDLEPQGPFDAPLFRSENDPPSPPNPSTDDYSQIFVHLDEVQNYEGEIVCRGRWYGRAGIPRWESRAKVRAKAPKVEEVASAGTGSIDELMEDDAPLELS